MFLIKNAVSRVREGGGSPSPRAPRPRLDASRSEEPTDGSKGGLPEFKKCAGFSADAAKLARLRNRVRLTLKRFSNSLESAASSNPSATKIAAKRALHSARVAGLPADHNDLAIVEAIILLAHKLDLQVVAEGVETLEQLETLRSLGCDTVQGYYLGKPVPLQALADTGALAH